MKNIEIKLTEKEVFFVIIALLLIAACVLAGCSSSDDPPEKLYKIETKKPVESTELYVSSTSIYADSYADGLIIVNAVTPHYEIRHVTQESRLPVKWTIAGLDITVFRNGGDLCIEAEDAR